MRLKPAQTLRCQFACQPSQSSFLHNNCNKTGRCLPPRRTVPEGLDVSWLKITLVAALLTGLAATGRAEGPTQGGPAVPAGRPGRDSDKKPPHAGAIVPRALPANRHLTA